MSIEPHCISFNFCENSAQSRKEGSGETPLLRLADLKCALEYPCWQLQLRSQKGNNGCEIQQCILNLHSLLDSSIFNFFTSEPDIWKALKTRWKAHCINSIMCAIHGRYPELDAPVACWTEVMMLEAITCFFFSFKECSELLKGRLQNMSWAMSWRNV